MMFGALFAWQLTRVSRELERINIKMKTGRRRPMKMENRQKHPDAQAEAFLAEVERQGNAYVMDADHGEFIIDGVVNVRAALDAAMAVERDGSATGTKGNTNE
jgi:hypothetical protein